MRISELQRDRRWPEFIQNAENRGRLDVLIRNLRDSYTRLEQRMQVGAGDENAMMRDRLHDVEQFLREIHDPTPPTSPTTP